MSRQANAEHQRAPLSGCRRTQALTCWGVPSHVYLAAARSGSLALLQYTEEQQPGPGRRLSVLQPAARRPLLPARPPIGRVKLGCSCGRNACHSLGTYGCTAAAYLLGPRRRRLAPRFTALPGPSTASMIAGCRVQCRGFGRSGAGFLGAFGANSVSRLLPQLLSTHDMPAWRCAGQPPSCPAPHSEPSQQQCPARGMLIPSSLVTVPSQACSQRPSGLAPSAPSVRHGVGGTPLWCTACQRMRHSSWRLSPPIC